MLQPLLLPALVLQPLLPPVLVLQPLLMPALVLQPLLLPTLVLQPLPAACTRASHLLPCGLRCCVADECDSPCYSHVTATATAM